AGDASLLRDAVRVETYLEARAVAGHLLQDPLARRSDAAVGFVSRRQRAARAEALELFQNGDQTIFGYRLHQLDDLRIEIGRRLWLLGSYHRCHRDERERG